MCGLRCAVHRGWPESGGPVRGVREPYPYTGRGSGVGRCPVSRRERESPDLETIREIGWIARHARQLGSTASPEDWAEYFERKAALFDRIADAPQTANPDEVREMAAEARQTARDHRSRPSETRRERK